MNNAWMNLSASLLLCTSCNFSLFPIIDYCLVPRNNWNKRAYARRTRKTNTAGFYLPNPSEERAKSADEGGGMQQIQQRRHHGVSFFYAREYLMIYKRPGFLAVVWLGSYLTPSPSLLSASCLSFSVFPFELLTGEWEGVEPKHTREARKPGPL